MIEAKKLAYADMLRYVGDPRFSKVPVAAMLSKDARDERAHADRSGEGRVQRGAVEARRPHRLTGRRHDLPVRHRQGRQHRLADPEHLQRLRPAASCRRAPASCCTTAAALFTLEKGHPNALAPRKRPLHTIIPAFMEKGDVKIGFGIMGGFNQAQAHAQFVANIADYGMDDSAGARGGPLHEGDVRRLRRRRRSARAGADAQRADGAAATTSRVVPPRTGTFGYGQAVMSDGAGVHFGASEPRHDGAAIPEAPPVFPDSR